MQEDMPERIPEDMPVPDRLPDCAQERESEDMPEKTSKDMPNRTRRRHPQPRSNISPIKNYFGSIRPRQNILFDIPRWHIFGVLSGILAFYLENVLAFYLAHLLMKLFLGHRPASDLANLLTFFRVLSGKSSGPVPAALEGASGSRRVLGFQE